MVLRTAPASPRRLDLPGRLPGEPLGSAIVGEDGGPMCQRQEGVGAVPLSIESDRVCTWLRQDLVDALGSIDIEDLDKTGVSDRHVEVAEDRVEEDDVGRAGEGEVGHDLVGGWGQDEQATRVAGAIDLARVVDLEAVRACGGVSIVLETWVGSAPSITTIEGGSAMLTKNRSVAGS
jgi:hypothetical protein